MKKYTWTKKLLAAMLATGMVVTSMPDTGLNVSKVFAAKVSTKQHTFTTMKKDFCTSIPERKQML